MSTNAIESIDLLVTDGGKTGRFLAVGRAKAGWKVVMMERQFVGGICIDVACVSTKPLVSSAHHLSGVRSDEMFGAVGTQSTHMSLAKLRVRKEGIVGAMVSVHEEMFVASDLDFVRGEIRFTNERMITIVLKGGDERVIRGECVLINPGSRLACPAIPSLWESGTWTNEEVLHLEELPSSLTIIGVNYIGVEFASMMATFDMDVTLISSGDHMLPHEGEDATRVVEAGLEAAGVCIVSGHAEPASREGSTTTLTFFGSSTVSVGTVLMVVGRAPNTDGISLDEVRVRLTDRGFVAVDEHLYTSAGGVWATGNYAGTPMFMHASRFDFRIIHTQLTGTFLDDATTTTKDRMISYAMFATPELARIGLFEGEARETGLDVCIVKILTAATPRTKMMRYTSEGFWKAVVDANMH